MQNPAVLQNTYINYPYEDFLQKDSSLPIPTRIFCFNRKNRCQRKVADLSCSAAAEILPPARCPPQKNSCTGFQYFSKTLQGKELQHSKTSMESLPFHTHPTTRENSQKKRSLLSSAREQAGKSSVERPPLIPRLQVDTKKPQPHSQEPEMPSNRLCLPDTLSGSITAGCSFICVSRNKELIQNKFCSSIQVDRIDRLVGRERYHPLYTTVQSRVSHILRAVDIRFHCLKRVIFTGRHLLHSGGMNHIIHSAECTVKSFFVPYIADKKQTRIISTLSCYSAFITLCLNSSLE